MEPRPTVMGPTRPNSRRFSRFALSRLALAAIAALSLYLGLARISQQGFSNYYYAAAVRSMTENWHAFYFVSLDPKGFVSIDKPPVGFWIQTVFALIFGFHGWAILLPEALAAAGSVVVLDAIVRPAFGVAAGLIAAFALAVAPINVAVSRNNTPDGLLVFALLLAAYCFARAIRSGRFAWLAASFAFVGVGFNIKMLEADLIAPALFITYLFASRVSFRRRIIQLAFGAVVLAAVSLSWATTVWMTPASQRPYVGSTKNNDIFSLIFGYNGLNRLLPRGWSIFGLTNGSSTASKTVVRGGIGGGRLTETGAQGLLRLFNHQLAGQVGWLIPVAIIGLAAAWGRPRWRRLTDQQLVLAMFGLWGAVEVGFFSLAGFFHRYYLATLSPAIAALTGIGIVALWNLFRTSGWRPWSLPAGFALAAYAQWRLLAPYAAWSRRLDPLLLAAGGVVIAATLIQLATARGSSPRSTRAERGVSLAAAGCLLALLAAPSVWSYTTLARGYFGALPVAGPTLSAAPTAPSPQSNGQSASLSAIAHAAAHQPDSIPLPPTLSQANKTMIAFLEKHRGHEIYLVAVQAAVESDSIILATGEPVMTLGGFSGGDPILTVSRLKALIAAHQVRFFLDVGMSADVIETLHTIGEQTTSSSRHHKTGHETISTWVEHNCTVVPAATVAEISPGASTSGLNGLFDCKAYAR